jgi:hypothetical protein
MDNRKTAALLGLAAALLLGAPAQAHHGFASYSHDVVTVEATVTEFKFINPHVQIYFDIKNDQGATEHWQGELTAPNKLARAGWTKRTFEPGDVLQISGEVARNGGHSIRVRKIITAEGEDLPLFESVD